MADSAHDMRAAALWYATGGIPVFPCKPRGKEPLTPHGFKDATTDLECIARWWSKWPDANIGIPTGAVSGRLVVDSDPRNGGPADRGTFSRRFGPIPDATPEVLTGGGGLHFYFRYNGGIPPKTLAAGVDLKGDGGYVIAPPSLHPSGTDYRVNGKRDALLSPPELPTWLQECITTKRNEPRAESTGGGTTWGRGERNDKLTSLGGVMRRRGCSREAIEAALLEENRRRCDPLLLDNEVRQIAASVARYQPPQANLQAGGRDVDAAAEKPTLTKGVSESSRFRLTDGGVIYTDPDPDKEPLQICGRLEVAALTRDAKGDGWGRLLRWADSEGRPHEWPMPMSLLAGDGNEYRARLLDGGLFLAPGSKARQWLPIYLQSMCPEKRALCVERVGWHGYSFVLPGETIGPEGAEMVLFQTPFETDNYLNVRGSVDEWRENVGRYCVGNSRLILVVSCAFAGPLLSLMGSESGGVHFAGATSTGKSTALLVGGSVLGGGGRNGFVQSWRTTANGLEAVAELHNDLTLFLDELAQMDPHEAAETAYLLGNGSGKTRMSRNIGARKKLSWSLLFVSAGEITLADHVQAAGKRTKGGAEVRLLNIEADAGAGLGLFENVHGAESADVFARQLKDAARRFYGAPLRAYLKNLTAKRATVETTVRNFQAEFLSRHVPAGASGEVLRAAQRFGLIGAAGELATDAGVTGWKADEAAGAAARCLKSWIAGRGTTGAGDAEAALRQVRRFLEAHGASRFQVIRPGATDSSNENQIVVNRAGFRQQAPDGETQFLILPETFKSEMCNGFDYRMVARTMKERNLLECQPPDLTRRFRLPGNIGLIRAFCIRSSILEG